MERESVFLNLPYIYSAIFNFIFNAERGGIETYWFYFWDIFLHWTRLIGWTLTFVFLALAIWVWKKRNAVIEAEDAKYHTDESSEVEGVSPAADKWMAILGHLNSANPNDWKVAILEADAILDEMVKGMGLKGDNLGERLKEVERSDFDTLDQAWEAHKIRNRVAHSSSDFVLTQREANRAIDLYRQVFEEFHYI